MFRTVALAFALVAAFGAFGYAQNMRGFQTLNVKGPRVAAGQVNSDGSTAQGTHFRVMHVSTGIYEITLDEHYFSNGCPILMLTGFGSLDTFGVTMLRCNVYYAEFAGPTGHLSDSAFNLAAVAAQ